MAAQSIKRLVGPRDIAALAVFPAQVEQDIPVNHSEFFAPLIEPTLSVGTQALVVAALTYLAK